MQQTLVLSQEIQREAPRNFGVAISSALARMLAALLDLSGWLQPNRRRSPTFGFAREIQESSRCPDTAGRSPAYNKCHQDRSPHRLSIAAAGVAQTVSRISCRHAAHWYTRTSASLPSGSNSMRATSISCPHRHVGRSVQPGSNKRSNPDI
jgi:hypothetical protein